MSERTNRIFKAIADPTRREIFHALILASVALPITQIASNFEISRQGVTKHIKTLEEAGLVEIHTQGRERFCKANAEPLTQINHWLQFYAQFWDQSLVKLGKHLDKKA